jgi:hypothetical protein
MLDKTTKPCAAEDMAEIKVDGSMISLVIYELTLLNK